MKPLVSTLPEWGIYPAQPMELATTTVLVAATAAAGVVVINEPAAVDYAAACLSVAAAAICWLFTHEKQDTLAHRLAWGLLTIILGSLTPRSLANRGIIQESFADFGIAAVVAAMLVPLVCVALWRRLSARADRMADKALDNIQLH